MNLEAAIEAARAESLERCDGARLTRDRVLEACARSPRRRVHAVVAAVIASMFGATAFAWYAHAPHSATPAVAAPAGPANDGVAEVDAPRDRLGLRVQTTVHVEPPAAEAPAVEPAAIERAPTASMTPAVERAAIERAPTASMTPAVERAPTASMTPAVERAAIERAPTASMATASLPTASEAAEPDADLALYATAHRLHFQARDPAAALVAWDRYLAAAPHGRLAPEARFNRLVALVRLERWADARTALGELDQLAHTDGSGVRPRDLEKLRALIAAHAR